MKQDRIDCNIYTQLAKNESPREIQKRLAKQTFLKEYREEEYAKLHRQVWRELHLGYHKDWCNNHPTYFVEYCRNWRNTHHDYAKNYSKKWREEHPGYYTKYRRKNRRKLRKYWRDYKRKVRMMHVIS